MWTSRYTGGVGSWGWICGSKCVARRHERKQVAKEPIQGTWQVLYIVRVLKLHTRTHMHTHITHRYCFCNRDIHTYIYMVRQLIL